MIDIIKTNEAKNIRSRIMEKNESVEIAVAGIIDDVKNNGDAALNNYTLKYDGVDVKNIMVTEEEINKGIQAVDKKWRQAMENAASNIEAYHKKQVRQGYMVTKESGVIMGQRVTPLFRAGIYVPGGTACYASSLLMNVIPAKIAGVKEIVLATPPQKDGSIKSSILAAAKRAGVNTIYKMGGAQAIAAMAYGTKTIPKVDKITGPGNIYVAAAKKLVYGIVDIDMIAGPSEVLIIADKSANPDFIAADMLAQAEHDTLAAAILLTTCGELADNVNKALEKQLNMLPRKEIAKASILENGRIIIVNSLEEAVALSNEIAPEHLELCVEDPFSLLGGVTNAGSVFMGNYTPEAVGDYYAGPNHTLPTGGAARFSSPLSVDDFIKKSSFLYYTKNELEKAFKDIEALALEEGLHAHAKSAAIRFLG